VHQEHEPPVDLAAALAGGGVHVVCIADAGAEAADSLLATAAGLDAAERSLFCERVNTDDATGSLWPIARLSALPARFGQAPLQDIEGLRRCLLRVFEVNATLCKCPVLILAVRGSAAAAEIAAEAERIHAELGAASLVQELRVT
jgi:hypothetical protein